MNVVEEVKKGIVGVVAEVSTLERFMLGMDMVELKQILKDAKKYNKKDERTVSISVGSLRKIDDFVSKFLIEVDVEAIRKGLYETKVEKAVNIDDLDNFKIEADVEVEKDSATYRYKVEECVAAGLSESDIIGLSYPELNMKLIRVSVDNMPKIGK